MVCLVGAAQQRRQVLRKIESIQSEYHGDSPRWRATLDLLECRDDIFSHKSNSVCRENIRPGRIVGSCQYFGSSCSPPTSATKAPCTNRLRNNALICFRAKSLRVQLRSRSRLVFRADSSSWRSPVASGHTASKTHSNACSKEMQLGGSLSR